MSENSEDVLSPETISAIEKLTDYLHGQVQTNMTLHAVESLMEPISSDQAWVYHGGSGTRSRFFLIDNHIQIRFDFDLEDLLISFSVFPKNEAWLKDSAEILLKGGEAPYSEIVIIPDVNDGH